MATIAISLDEDLTAGLTENELTDLRRLLARLFRNLEEDHDHDLAAR